MSNTHSLIIVKMGNLRNVVVSYGSSDKIVVLCIKVDGCTVALGEIILLYATNAIIDVTIFAQLSSILYILCSVRGEILYYSSIFLISLSLSLLSVKHRIF